MKPVLDRQEKRSSAGDGRIPAWEAAALGPSLRGRSTVLLPRDGEPEVVLGDREGAQRSSDRPFRRDADPFGLSERARPL